MTAITLRRRLEAWAEAEVAAGRAESIEVLKTTNSGQDDDVWS